MSVRCWGFFIRFDNCSLIDIIRPVMSILSKIIETGKLSVLVKIEELRKQQKVIEEEIAKLIQDNDLADLLKDEDKASPQRTTITRKVLHYFTVEKFLKKNPLSKDDFWKLIQADEKLKDTSEEMFNKTVQHYIGNGKIAEVKGKLTLKK